MVLTFVYIVALTFLTFAICVIVTTLSAYFTLLFRLNLRLWQDKLPRTMMFQNKVILAMIYMFALIGGLWCRHLMLWHFP